MSQSTVNVLKIPSLEKEEFRCTNLTKYCPDNSRKGETRKLYCR